MCRKSEVLSHKSHQRFLPPYFAPPPPPFLLQLPSLSPLPLQPPTHRPSFRRIGCRTGARGRRGCIPGIAQGMAFLGCGPD